MPDVNRRRYRSPLRDEHAGLTRRRILAAATRLFGEHGYAATSLEAIAAAAGVGRSTVCLAAGCKAELLKCAIDIALAGDDQPIPVPERPEMQALQAETDPVRLLTGFAAQLRAMNSRVALVYEAVRGAAGADPVIRQLWQSLQDQRLAGARRIVATLVAISPLDEHLDEQAAGDLLWLLMDPAHYLALVCQRGWTAQRYQDWIATTMCQQLLPDPHRPGSAARPAGT